eukprot:GHVP01010540.1.p1 GENE.GHVP01010540.1~~GHVP01010540.1.p1  ORF type:complete len:293 (-),score=64.14 GHVP01010540.1:140-997(-)
MTFLLENILSEQPNIFTLIPKELYKHLVDVDDMKGEIILGYSETLSSIHTPVLNLLINKEGVSYQSFDLFEFSGRSVTIKEAYEIFLKEVNKYIDSWRILVEISNQYRNKGYLVIESLNRIEIQYKKSRRLLASLEAIGNILIEVDEERVICDVGIGVECIAVKMDGMIEGIDLQCGICLDRIIEDGVEVVEDFQEDMLEENKVIHEDIKITTKYITKYEKARVIGTRAVQLSKNAPPLVELNGETDALEIAEKEFNEKKIPFIIRRHLPGGEYEDWSLKDLITD